MPGAKPRRGPQRGAATAETMRQLRVAIRLAMRHTTLQQAAARAECSENTISRILRGEDALVGTIARIAEGLGACIEIRLGRPSKKPNR